MKFRRPFPIQDLPPGGCTPGVYLQVAPGGVVRVGESACIEKRAPQSARENADCLGPFWKGFVSELIAISSVRKAAEKKMILKLLRQQAKGKLTVCNRIAR